MKVKFSVLMSRCIYIYPIFYCPIHFSNVRNKFKNNNTVGVFYFEKMIDNYLNTTRKQRYSDGHSDGK